MTLHYISYEHFAEDVVAILLKNFVKTCHPIKLIIVTINN